jgi:MoaA/NifB/PqqE/SkfB family radical SAM enzyme
MNISGQNIETLRSQLSLPIKEFCRVLNVDIDTYALFLSANDFGKLPVGARDRLISLMREEETKNLAAYKYLPETAGYFSNSKILKHLDKLSLLENDPEKTGPITVEFHPTNSCNHACPACTFAMPKRDHQHMKSFDIHLLDRLIEDLTLVDTRGIFISGGGEPLCHTEIGKIINSFVKKFDVGLATNGYALSDKKDSDGKKELRSAILRCTWCRISVDAGSQEVYSLMHGNMPHIKFDDIVHKVELLASDKIRSGSNATLGISFLLTPYNFLDLIGSICIFRKIKGIDYFQVKPVVITPAERIKEGMIFWDKRVFEILDAIKEYETETFKIFTLSYKFSDMLLQEESGLPFQKCWGHPLYPAIAADGSVLVCCHMLNHLLDDKDIGIYGKITGHEGFLDIWNKKSRWEKGGSVQVSSCPCNCKLSETNKMLESFRGRKIMHKNFIN